jgi:glycerophosphoryl diester phosphodiesterase
LEAARAAAPGLPRGLIVEALPGEWNAALSRLQCFSLHCNHERLQPSQVAPLHGAGYALLCWTVNEPQTARRLLRWGADCLVTDALEDIGPDFRAA